jgi:hypothetical protein
MLSSYPANLSTLPRRNAKPTIFKDILLTDSFLIEEPGL